METKYLDSDFIPLKSKDVPNARTVMMQFAGIVMAIKKWKGRVEFCKQFYTAISRLNNTFDPTIEIAAKEQFKGYLFAVGDEQIELSKVYSMIHPSSGNINGKQFAAVAAAFNDLYAKEIHYRISKDWELEHMETSVSEQVLQPGTKDIAPEHPDERLAELEYTGKWQAVHLYSRASFDHKKEVHLLRQICIEILASGKAKLQYMDSVRNKKIEEIPQLGEVTLGKTGRQLFIHFSYETDYNDQYKARAIYCLTLQDHGHLQGSYVGFSPTSMLPYGGAISLRKLGENETPVIQNYKLESGAQTIELWETAEIEGLRNAYASYLETPEKSFSKVLHARFRKYGIKTDLTGNFITIGIGSGGGDDKELNTLVSYPMHFHNGLCTTNWKKGEASMESPIRSIGDTQKHIWLHLYNEKRLTNISYYIGDVEEQEYRGISFRLNANGKLQARTEILIRKDKLQPDEEVLKKYTIGSQQYARLKRAYYDTHPFFRELIDSFEPRVHERADNGSHILQNRTKTREKSIAPRKVKSVSPGISAHNSIDKSKGKLLPDKKKIPVKKSSKPGTATAPLPKAGRKK